MAFEGSGRKLARERCGTAPAQRVVCPAVLRGHAVSVERWPGRFIPGVGVVLPGHGTEGVGYGR